MTSVLSRRHHATEPSNKAVRYTPCSKDDQTDEEELDEIAITTPIETRPPSSPRERSVLEEEDYMEQGPSITANGPRVLPGAVATYTAPTDRTKLIAERLVNRSQSPIYSSGRASNVHSTRSPSKSSIFEMVTNKIESVKNGSRKKSRSSVLNSDSLGYVNKAHISEPVTPKFIRKQRKKDIEDKFGTKKSRSHERHETSTNTSFRDGCKWTFVFDPAGRFAYWWSCVVSVAFLYNFWVIIYRFAFEEIDEYNKTIWFALDYSADFLYVLDVAFHFRTGFLEDGVLQTDGTKLRLHYMNSTIFYIDCLCLLPLDFLYLSIGYKSMLRCFRLVKIYRFWAFLDRTERHTNYPNVVRTVTLLHYLFAIYHWNACLIFLVSKHLENDAWLLKETNDILIVYLHSLYWSTLTLTTIGDLPKPIARGEYIFVIVEFVFGLLLFSTILGHVANIVTGISFARRDFQAKLDSVKTYMTLRRVPLRLQDRVIKWFDYLWLSKKSSDEEKTLGLLPNKLKAEIALHVHLDTLKRVEIFQNTEAGFLCELVLRLKPVLFSPKDYICTKGEVGKEMYIVNRGRLQVVADNGKTVLATLRPGSYFGEISILNMGNAGNRRTASVRSVGYSDLFCLSKNDLWEVLKDYPTARVRLEAIAVKRLEKYKKAPLEKVALSRSKSTPGLLETLGQIPLDTMPINRHNTMPTDTVNSNPSSLDGTSHCSFHSRMEDVASFEDQPTGSELSHTHSDQDGESSSALKMAASADITHSMTVSSIASYVTDASAQRSPHGIVVTTSPTSPRPFPTTSAMASGSAHGRQPSASQRSPSQSPFVPIEPQGAMAYPNQSPVAFNTGQELPNQRVASPRQRPYNQQPTGIIVTHPQLAQTQISPFNSPYLVHTGLPQPPPPPPPPSHGGLQPLPVQRPMATSPGLLSVVSSHNSPMSVSPTTHTSFSISPGGFNNASSGSLPASDQSTEALLHEITRLRERLQTLETENASMNLTLSQKQWEVDNRLAEIELHICGSDESADDEDPDDEDDEHSVTKESVI